jgi:hypothetical protein
MGWLTFGVPVGHGRTMGWQLLQAGRLADARARFWEEARLADAADDADGLASAAVGLGGVWVHEHRATLERAEVRALQERALGAVAPASPWARRLRIRLAAEHAYETGDRRALSAELACARRHGTPIELAEALSLTHHCLLGPDDATARMALADELIAVAPRTGRSLDGLMGLAWRTVDLFLDGDRRASRSLIELRGHLDDDPCAALGYVVSALDVMLAIRAGRLAEAEQLVGRSHALGCDVGDADALGWLGAQLVCLRWLQGRGGDVLELLDELVCSPTVTERCVGFEAARGALAAASGDLTTAASALAAIGPLAAIPSSSVWSATMHGIAEAAHALGDESVCAEVYGLLAPHAERPMMVSLGVACFGSTHRPLGLAALTLGDVDLAVSHLEAALRADLALGHLPCVALDRAALGDALRRRGAPYDVARASELVALAIADARRFGMDGRAERWHAVPDDDEITCRRSGRLWHVEAAGRAASVPHSVGMGYLAELVDHPGREIAAIELASGHQLSDRSARQAIIDEDGRLHYRRVIEDLREEIADAEQDADPERATRARLQLDLVLDDLARATGLSGHDRCFADEAERARVSVHKAIRRAIVRLADADPAIGRLLARRVRTGVRCVYRPVA